MTRFKRLIVNNIAVTALSGLAALAQITPQALSTPSNERRQLSAVGVPIPGSVAEERLGRAHRYFQDGKNLLQEGDIEGARSAFDRAIEILLNTPLTAEDRSRVERRVEELVDLISRYDLDDLGSGETRDQVAFDKSPLDDIRELNFPLNPKQKGLAQHQVGATQSQLPLETNDAVLSFINYFSSTSIGRNTLINGWRRSMRYRPMIERILAEEGVPQELIYLAQAESGFLPRAVSRKAACGMWQFVAWRGKEYGLEQTPHVDLRLDPERATRAAARHLRDLYQQFGDWYLALAAYNCGPGCVDRAVQRTGYADYWELRRIGAIPKETTNYVPIIVAMTIVSKNAADYGIVLDDPTPAIQYDVLKVDTPTNVELIADAADLPVSGIRDLNPALLRNVAPAGYEVRVPKGQSEEIASAIETVPSVQRAASRLHRVKPGENLTEIALTYRTSARTILAANAHADASLEEGEMLIVPASFDPPAKKKVVKTKARYAKKPAVQRSQKSQPSFRTAGRRASAK